MEVILNVLLFNYSLQELLFIVCVLQFLEQPRIHLFLLFQCALHLHLRMQRLLLVLQYRRILLKRVRNLIL